MTTESHDNIKQLIPDKRDGIERNIAELLMERRNGNIECLMLCYKRKEDGSMRTFFIGADNPKMYLLLKRLEHDMLGLYNVDVDHVEYYDD